MKHAVLFVIALLLGALGAFILVWDIVHGGQLHVVSASVGTGCLVGALGLALPVQVRCALDALTPLLPFVRKDRG